MILLSNGQVAQVVASSATFVRVMRSCGIWSDTYPVARSAK